jgi:exosortase K
MTRSIATKRIAQSAAVVLCAFVVKLHYSTAGADELRWILAPTAAAVGAVSGARFEFEPHAGYINGDRSFVIAASCAGVNFLITAFLMLSLRGLWANRSREAAWGFIPCAAAAAYAATLAANTVRISAALSTRGLSHGVGWLGPGQLHRLEGIVIYFGFLLLLFAAAERVCAEGEPGSSHASGLFRRPLFPLLVYYATTLGIPLLNGAYRRGADFREHTLFVILTPLLLALPLATLRLVRARQQGRRRADSPDGVA